MICIIPTKQGMGIEFWGTYDDLANLYQVIGRFWSSEIFLNQKGFESRDKLISSFSYEIRKAKEGARLKRKNSPFSSEKQEYLGTKFSWVHILFALTAMKFNMRYYETNKSDIAQILTIEFELEKAMKSFDEATAKNLIGFIEDGLYGGNNYIYQYMQSINIDYFRLGRAKQAFKKLPDLLMKGSFSSAEYKEYEEYLQKEAKRLGCEITDLEFNDDDIDYEKMLS